MAVTVGDPEGVGPEIIERIYRNHSPSCATMILAPSGLFPSDLFPQVNAPEEITGIGPFLLTPALREGEVSFELVRRGADLALAGAVQALVTGPISKFKWKQAGIPHAGHTDFLAAHAGGNRCIMAFWSEGIRLVLFTTHIPLQGVFSQVRRDRIVDFMETADAQLRHLLGKAFPFVFCGLNPHSGEDGVLGTEELDEIIPAIEILKAKMQIVGLFPPDVAFLKCREIADAVAVCWYHDQGLIPFKLLHFHDGVNLTLGLPYIRTSPDHGTAFDIVGRGIADPSSMLAAIRLAESLARSAFQ